MMKVWAVVLVAALAVVHPSVEAKRMGGGGSMGKQSSNVTQREAAPRAPQQAPAQQQAATPKPATPAATPAAPAKKPWGAMLGGLAAGLGLAWLANSLGMGEAFANMLMFGLLALAVMVVIGIIYRYGPNVKAPRTPIFTWGALFAALAWAGASYGFSAYLGSFNSYNKIYGSIGAVVALLMWFFLGGFSVLTGALINLELARRRRFIAAREMRQVSREQG